MINQTLHTALTNGGRQGGEHLLVVFHVHIIQHRHASLHVGMSLDVLQRSVGEVGLQLLVSLIDHLFERVGIGALLHLGTIVALQVLHTLLKRSRNLAALLKILVEGAAINLVVAERTRNLQVLTRHCHQHRISSHRLLTVLHRVANLQHKGCGFLHIHMEIERSILADNLHRLVDTVVKVGHGNEGVVSNITQIARHMEVVGHHAGAQRQAGNCQHESFHHHNHIFIVKVLRVALYRLPMPGTSPHHRACAVRSAYLSIKAV